MLLILLQKKKKHIFLKILKRVIGMKKQSPEKHNNTAIFIILNQNGLKKNTMNMQIIYNFF